MITYSARWLSKLSFTSEIVWWNFLYDHIYNLLQTVFSKNAIKRIDYSMVSINYLRTVSRKIKLIQGCNIIDSCNFNKSLIYKNVSTRIPGVWNRTNKLNLFTVVHTNHINNNAGVQKSQSFMRKVFKFTPELFSI